jgi:hypothetical protein
MANVLTESEVWEILSKALVIKSVYTGDDYFLRASFNGEMHDSYGLCQFIDVAPVADGVRSLMKSRMTGLKTVYLQYYWLLTEKGQKERKAFAAAQATATK